MAVLCNYLMTNFLQTQALHLNENINSTIIIIITSIFILETAEVMTILSYIIVFSTEFFNQHLFSCHTTCLSIDIDCYCCILQP